MYNGLPLTHNNTAIEKSLMTLMLSVVLYNNTKLLGKVGLLKKHYIVNELRNLDTVNLLNFLANITNKVIFFIINFIFFICWININPTGTRSVSKM